MRQSMPSSSIDAPQRTHIDLLIDPQSATVRQGDLNRAANH
jgi:hypothetical protein